MLDGVKAGAFGEHPACEDAVLVARELDLVDLHERGRVRRLGRRARIANARRNLQRAEFDCLIDGHFQMRDAARHFVEGGEDGDLVLDGLGMESLTRQRHGACRNRCQKRSADKPPPIHGDPFASHHAAHLIPPCPRRFSRVCSLSIKRLVDHWGNGVAQAPHS